MFTFKNLHLICLFPKIVTFFYFSIDTIKFNINKKNKWIKIHKSDNTN